MSRGGKSARPAAKGSVAAQCVCLDRGAPGVAKGYRDGTHRTITPEETLDRLRPHLAPLGITRVANVTGLDRLGIPVVMVCRPNSRSLAVSQGKGLTLAAARASGLLETVELHCAERIALPLLVGSVEDLSPAHRLVELQDLPVARTRRPSDRTVLTWVEGYDVLGREAVWVPYELVSTNAAGPGLPGEGCFCATSNGLASGNTLLEAISHGLCEAVERDATTLWYRRPAAAQADTALDLDSVDDAGCRQVLACCARAGVEALVWETTSDVGIPSFLCLLQEPGGLHRDAALGMGCHPSRAIALLRALTEAAQSRLTLISGARDDLFRDEYEWNHFTAEDLERYHRLQPSGGPRRRFCDAPSHDAATFDDDLRWELTRLRAAGLEHVIVVDLSLPEFPASVVRVVVPGLEGPSHSPDYTPGRRALEAAP